ncbi:Abscission/NoCut checkpoint regulator [Allomyces javanicus]|nr:Abscission/NoCut checkpoint regulator [Allomyces javanicus]
MSDIDPDHDLFARLERLKADPPIATTDPRQSSPKNASPTGVDPDLLVRFSALAGRPSVVDHDATSSIAPVNRDAHDLDQALLDLNLHDPVVSDDDDDAWLASVLGPTGTSKADAAAAVFLAHGSADAPASARDMAEADRLLQKALDAVRLEQQHGHPADEDDDQYDALAQRLAALKTGAPPAATKSPVTSLGPPPITPPAVSGSRSALGALLDEDELVCCICNDDATVICVDCDEDMYCAACFRQGHADGEERTHRARKI